MSSVRVAVVVIIIIVVVLFVVAIVVPRRGGTCTAEVRRRTHRCDEIDLSFQGR